VVREALGIQKRVAVSIGHRERLRRFGFGSASQETGVSASGTGGNEPA
jgi:hypothetical protein